MQRGLNTNLAKQVATQVTARNALVAPTHDEVGISDTASVKLLQVALVPAALSNASFM